MEGKIVEYVINSDVKRPALVVEHDKKTGHATLMVFAFQNDGITVGGIYVPLTDPPVLVRINKAARGFDDGQWHEYEKEKKGLFA